MAVPARKKSAFDLDLARDMRSPAFAREFARAQARPALRNRALVALPVLLLAWAFLHLGVLRALAYRSLDLGAGSVQTESQPLGGNP